MLGALAFDRTTNRLLALAITVISVLVARLVLAQACPTVNLDDLPGFAAEQTIGFNVSDLPAGPIRNGAEEAIAIWGASDFADAVNIDFAKVTGSAGELTFHDTTQTIGSGSVGGINVVNRNQPDNTIANAQIFINVTEQLEGPSG